MVVNTSPQTMDVKGSIHFLVFFLVKGKGDIFPFFLGKSSSSALKWMAGAEDSPIQKPDLLDGKILYHIVEETYFVS